MRTCSVDDLENIYGLGRKTSRCFLIHTRKNARVAGLDVHILKFLRDQGIDAPISTPSSRKKYLELEKTFIEFADKAGKPIAEYDLAIWRKYREKRMLVS